MNTNAYLRGRVSELISCSNVHGDEDLVVAGAGIQSQSGILTGC